ncbi:hypothetical protein DL237_01615 [Pseudooceanicola sediminis]|uniref:Uncharacterized protein n=1 Tax=Pseudooceanicola sediminis TaxID=2211117 RepID=A0A399J9N1_9RHOB|nr:hypothetical protein E0K93_00305 [Puniceibacterium sp. HSS470]RII40732.1 hypothetical protein DL237_01615 [Pseudooceanicola sediminis]
MRRPFCSAGGGTTRKTGTGKTATGKTGTGKTGTGKTGTGKGSARHPAASDRARHSAGHRARLHAGQGTAQRASVRRARRLWRVLRFGRQVYGAARGRIGQLPFQKPDVEAGQQLVLAHSLAFRDFGQGQRVIGTGAIAEKPINLGAWHVPGVRHEGGSHPGFGHRIAPVAVAIVHRKQHKAQREQHHQHHGCQKGDRAKPVIMPHVPQETAECAVGGRAV